LTEPEITDRIDKLENKIKLSNLLTGKKFADLELNIGKFEGKLNEFSADFTKIKERTEEIEDILNVINLGITEYKEKLEEIGSKVSGTQNIPEDIEKTMTDYQNRLNALDNNIKNILETINSLKTIKEQLDQTMGETFIQNIEILKRNSARNKIEMEHIKRDLDAFSSTIKSFERTLDLMNLDSLVKRFESVDNKIMNVQSQIQEFKGTLNNLTFSGEDLKVLKNQVNGISSSLTDKFNQINELEKSVKIIKQKIHDVNFFDTSSEGKENLLDQSNIKIDELTSRVDRLWDEVTKLSSGEQIQPAETPSLDRSEIEEVYGKVKEMYDEISGKISELKDLEEKLKPKEITEGEELTHDAARTLAKINEKIINLEKRHNELVDVLQAELQAMKEFTPSKNGTITLKGTEGIENVLASWDKNFEEYRKQVDKRFNILESKKFSGLPKDLIEELNLMRETLVRLSTENQELRKLGREIRVSQLESTNLQTFNALTEKVGLLEKKISEIEESMNKEFSVQTQRKEILDNFRKEIEDSKKILESKIINIESSKDVIESKIGKIEKKLKEEDIIKPIILE
jgi:chromosome segregation ATPase